MKGSRAGGAVAAVAIAVAIATGCGGGRGGTSGDTSVAVSTPKVVVPTPKAVAACFRREGAVSVYQRTDRGVRFVNGLVGGAYAVSAEFTGDQATTEEFLQRYEAEEPTELEAFEVLEGAAVGVINEKRPANKQIVIGCLEGRAR